ncbi:MAG: isocitrate/isopropylmalate dehydrogenase family protein [Phycisphaerales bacterium]|nr:MAG: isocitrate/isopropylmalate dehydrogenase family protein [Phycisphaerales bacterium]
MSTHTVVLIPGDGIGPEVSDATRHVLEAAGAPVQFDVQLAGESALNQTGETLPQQTIDAIAMHGVALKGPCTTPVGKGFSSVNVALRKRLDLYAAVRPVRSLPGVETRYKDVDLVIVRENTEGLYSGIENVVTEGVIVSMKVATLRACERISRWAFDYAKKRGRTRVTVFHKANIMKLTDGMMLDVARRVASEYPGVAVDDMIIDAACMKMVQDPGNFEVVLCENLYGDIISDLCAGLVGGLGVVPGANIGEKAAVFEAVHGSAPTIAGKGVANPLALIMSGVMMLNHLAETRNDETCVRAAARIKNAYDAAMRAGEKTADLGGELGTMDFAEVIAKRIKA